MYPTFIQKLYLPTFFRAIYIFDTFASQVIILVLDPYIFYMHEIIPNSACPYNNLKTSSPAFICKGVLGKFA